MIDDKIYIMDMAELEDATIKDFEEALVQLRIGPGINEDVSEEYNEATDLAIKLLEREIKTKARVGRWLLRFENSDVPTVCSECGHWFTEYVCGWEWEENGDLPNFCPNCGVKMKKEKNNEEA